MNSLQRLGVGLLIGLLASTVVGCASGRMRKLDRGKGARGASTHADDRLALDEGQRLAVVRFGKCTATHVGNGFFLTAGHCVNEARGFEGHRSSPCPHQLSWSGGGGACNVEVYRYDDGHDYALLRLVEPETAEDLPLVPIDYRFDWDKARKRPLSLFGYSKGTLQLDRTCSGKIANQTFVLHDCTTEAGDSGSALIDQDTHHIIGVHGGALEDGANYASPVEQIPWGESLCVASSSSKPIEIEPGGAPAAFRVSTSHARGAFRRVSVALMGSLPKADLIIRIVAPHGVHEVGADDVAWKTATDWSWSGMYELEDDDAAKIGPWSVEVQSAASGGAKQRSGHVQGEIWVCP